jgi:hypothetical protein
MACQTLNELDNKYRKKCDRHVKHVCKSLDLYNPFVNYARQQDSFHTVLLATFGHNNAQKTQK